MRLVLAFFFASFISLAGAAEAVKLPPKAQEAMDKLEKSEGKLTAEHKKAINAERNKTISDLQKAQKEITKSGDLDGALAIKKQIETLQAKIAEDDDTDLLGAGKTAKVDPAKLLIGKWDFTKTNSVIGTLDFKADGNCIASVTAPLPFPYIPCKWEIKDGKVLLSQQHDPSKVDTLTFTAANKMVGDTHDAGKNSVNATKQPSE
jgi:hypothetical protein